MTLTTFLHQPLFLGLGWVLVHFVWQGTLVALFLFGLFRLAPIRSANLRYLLACAALLLMIALPLATSYQIASTASYAVNMTPEKAVPSSGLASLPAPSTVSVALETGARSRLSQVCVWLDGMAPWFVLVWLMGVVALNIRFVGGLIAIEQLKRVGITRPPLAWEARLKSLADRFQIRHSVRLLQSAFVDVPTVAGWIRPVILAPASAFVGLPADYLAALLAHELAHIRRHDYLVNLLQAAVETLLFYHPAVWWVSRQIRIEREYCCDDLAVATCGSSLEYARALTELQELCSSRGPQLAVAAKGGSLAARVRRLLEPGEFSPAPISSAWSTGSASWLTSLIALIVVACLCGMTRGALPVDKPKIGQSATIPAADAAQTPALAPTEKKTTDSAAGAGRQRTIKADLHNQSNSERGVVQVDGNSNTTLAQTSVVEPRRAAIQISSHSAPIMGWAFDPFDEPGPSPDATGFVDRLAALGYARLSIDELLKLRYHGVSPSYVKALNELGYRSLPVEDLIHLRDHVVTADFVKGLAGVGYSRVASYDLIRMKDDGVVPDYIAAVAEAGFKRLSPQQLINLQLHFVSPQWLREVAREGYSALPIDSLVIMHDRGITAQFLQKVKSHGFADAKLPDLLRLYDSRILD